VLRETGGDAGRAAEAVIQRAEQRDSKDNITCMIVLFGGAAPEGGMDDGRFAFPLGKTVEFNACSLLGCDNSSYLTAYSAMCGRAGVTMGQAVEGRHELLRRKQSMGGMSEDDQEELEIIGEPEGAPGSEERKAWFENWAEEVQARGRGSEGDGGPGGGLGGGDQQEMMQMLMAMMMQRSAGGGMGPPGAGMGPRQ
jgi:hypothetical protein